ncbi:MAG: 50S ribosomal protein L3 [Patescibacteria group bacterium]
MKFVLATKEQMEQRFNAEGNAVAVTIVKVDPCVITQIKTEKSDGYNALQVASGSKLKNVSKPLVGHFKKATNSDSGFKKVAEVRVDNPQDYSAGQVIDIASFIVGEEVKVTGISKGKGFQGVVRRHKFHGHPATHGHKDQERMPGSIGAGGFQRVIKGMRMAGRMGNEQITAQGMKIFAVNPENSTIEIAGSVPGHRGTWLEVYTEGELKIKVMHVDEVKVAEPVVEQKIEDQNIEDKKTEDKVEEINEEIKA